MTLDKQSRQYLSCYSSNFDQHQRDVFSGSFVTVDDQFLTKFLIFKKYLRGQFQDPRFSEQKNMLFPNLPTKNLLFLIGPTKHAVSLATNLKPVVF